MANSKFPTTYPHLTNIAEKATQSSLRLVWDQLRQHNTDRTDMMARLEALESGLQTVSIGAQKLIDDSKAAKKAVKVSVAGAGGSGSSVAGADDGGQGNDGFNSAGATGHVAAGSPLTLFTVGQIVGGTVNEFPALLVATVDQPTRDANQLQLLLRIIWHLNLAGFTAGRQQNPSTALSADKFTVQVGSTWWCYDVFTGVYTETLKTQMFPVSGAHYIVEPGTAD